MAHARKICLKPYVNQSPGNSQHFFYDFLEVNGRIVQDVLLTVRLVSVTDSG